MQFERRIKASITQTLFRALSEDAGYHIVPLGIEEVIREVKGLSARKYLNLDLSSELRTLPDFFIADEPFEKAWLIEVKYRKHWNDASKRELKRVMEKQVKKWQPVFLVLFLGEKARDTETPASYIGIIKLTFENQLLCSRLKKRFPGELWETKPWDAIDWGTFNRFQDIFTEVGTKWMNRTLIQTVSILKSLAELEYFEEF